MIFWSGMCTEICFASFSILTSITWKHLLDPEVECEISCCWLGGTKQRPFIFWSPSTRRVDPKMVIYWAWQIRGDLCTFEFYTNNFRVCTVFLRYGSLFLPFVSYNLLNLEFDWNFCWVNDSCFGFIFIISYMKARIWFYCYWLYFLLICISFPFRLGRLWWKN